MLLQHTHSAGVLLTRSGNYSKAFVAMLENAQANIAAA